MIFKFVRWTRQLRIFFGGNKDREEKYRLFQIKPLVTIEEFRKRLIPLCYQYNPFSHTFKGQIWTVRKLDTDGKHQYHLRYYKDGWVTGHWEIDWAVDATAHNKSADIRGLTQEEIRELKNALGVV